MLIVVDPVSDITISTLAQVLLQAGRSAEALEYFDKAVELGRNESELITALSYAEVSPSYSWVAITYCILGYTSTARCNYKILSSSRKIIKNDSSSTARWFHGLVVYR